LIEPPAVPMFGHWAILRAGARLRPLPGCAARQANSMIAIY
jgi:hypothetical protein